MGHIQAGQIAHLMQGWDKGVEVPGRAAEDKYPGGPKAHLAQQAAGGLDDVRRKSPTTAPWCSGAP